MGVFLQLVTHGHGRIRVGHPGHGGERRRRRSQMWETYIVSAFDFPQLDARARDLMMEEFAYDRDSDRIYVGRRLNSQGERTYCDALPLALRQGTPVELRQQLEPVPGSLWISSIMAANGRRSTTPVTAAQTLAEGEFNRYYMRAICRRAVDEGNGTVRVRRGKAVQNPRADPSVRVHEGDILDASVVLEDIRLHPGEDTVIGMPRGPNSGLSLEFVPS